MFIFKLGVRDLDRAITVSKVSGITLKQVVRLAIRNGLAALSVEGEYFQKPLKRKLRYDAVELEKLIRQHWETKSDWDIGRMMRPTIPGGIVQRVRYGLGLKRAQGIKPTVPAIRALRTSLDAEEFERMLLTEGYTIADYLRIKHLSCTVERIRQIADELGLKHRPCDRKPEWDVMRKARRFGNMNLTNREWLAQEIRTMVSVTALAAEYGMSEYNLTYFIRTHKLTHPSFRKHGVETEQLVCSNPDCRTKFTRLKRWTNVRRAQSGNGDPTFYCSIHCVGKAARKVKRVPA